MKFGINIPNFGEYYNPKTVMQLAQESERSGWDGFFVWDHILGWKDSKMPINDPWIVLAAIATVTTRIKLGPMITPIPRRRPWKLARETVSIDHLSNGRLILGVGLGYPPDAEFEFFNEESDAKQRAKALDEGLVILKGLWSGTEFSYTGEIYNLKKMIFLPKPVQTPRIPIWVAGMWPNKAPFRRAAQWDGVFPIRSNLKTMTPELIQNIKNEINQYRNHSKPFDIVINGATPGDDPNKQKEILLPFHKTGVTWWHENISGERDTPKEMLERIKQGPPIIQ